MKKSESFKKCLLEICERRGINTANQLYIRLDENPAINRSSESLKRSCHHWFAGTHLPRKSVLVPMAKELELNADETRIFFRSLEESRKAQTQKPTENSTPAKFLVIACILILGLGFLAWNLAKQLYISKCENHRSNLFDAAIHATNLKETATKDCFWAAYFNPNVGWPHYVMGIISLENAKQGKDFSAAHEHFVEGHSLKDPRASLEVGKLIEDGYVPSALFDEERFEAAARYFEIAAEGGVPEGKFCYAISIIFKRIKVKNVKETVVENLEAASVEMDEASHLLNVLRDPKATATIFSECSKRHRYFNVSQDFYGDIKRLFIHTE